MGGDLTYDHNGTETIFTLALEKAPKKEEVTSIK
jgi:hypothetical protein